ncbi:hypothetical protein [uncultured Robinsoniella sp.]|uniref:hypothetical protein n=1 Tax=uncultured Robinsoniella sp. TaxID=904190 RepID=UPI00374FD9AB
MEKKERGSKKWAVLLLLLLLAAAAVAGYFLLNKEKMDDTSKYWFDKMAKDGTLEGKTPTELQGMLDGIVQEGMFNVSMNVEPVFKDGKSEGNLGIENIKENRYYCRVTLTLDKDQTVLYQSDGLKPGQYIDKVKLEHNLEAGEYDCTAVVTATDPESLEDIGQVNVKVRLKILN